MPIDINRFLIAAEQEGMPVTIVRFVWSNYGTEIGKANITWGAQNRIEFHKDDVNGIQTAELGNHPTWNGPTYRQDWIYNVSELNFVDTLYHEVAHAYCDLKLEAASKDMTGMLIARVFERAAEYHKGATVERHGQRSTATKPRKIVNEAIAAYVAHRASIMWEVLDCLHFMLRHGISNDPRDRRPKMSEMRPYYIRQMNRRLFGYEERGTPPNSIAWWVKDRDVPDFLADFCDDILLEGKIPKSFDGASRLVTLSHQVYRKLGTQPARGMGRHR